MDRPLPASSVAEFEQQYVRPKKGRTLIVGSRVYANRTDRRLNYDNAIGIDMLEGEGVDLVLDLEEELPEGLGTFDHIDCLSVLEHSRRPWLLAANLERLMRGTIYVSVPFVWRPHSYPNDYWRMTIEGVRSIFPNVKWDALMYAHLEATDKVKIPAIVVNGYRYTARTETMAFGRIS